MLKNHPTHLVVAILIAVVTVLGCGVIVPTPVPVIPTTQPVVPSIQAPVVPTVYQPVYARAQIGSYLSIWITYDPSLWDAAIWVDGANQAGEPVQQLLHKTLSGCALHDNLGHGASPTWAFGNYTKNLGTLIFQIDQWTDSTTNNPILLVYQYPAGDQTDSTKRIELEPGIMPYDCINAADVVIGLSAADIVK